MKTPVSTDKPTIIFHPEYSQPMWRMERMGGEPETVYVGFEGIECPCLRGRGGEPGVLFLHGYSFRGLTWARTSVFKLLGEKNVAFAAPDMPYGRSTGCSKRTRDLRVNLGVAHDSVRACLGGSPPILVGASLGGRVALHYALRYPIRGLLLLSPYIVDDEEVVKLARRLRGIPSLVVVGERDFVPRDILESLASQLGAELKIYPRAGHAMYLDRPDLFKEDLLRILEAARKS